MGRFRSFLLFWIMNLTEDWSIIKWHDPDYYRGWCTARRRGCWKWVYDKQYLEMRCCWFHDQRRRRAGKQMIWIEMWDPGAFIYDKFTGKVVR